MDLRQLRYFIGIVQAGSLSRAADRLHVAQSAISHHLASLEAELGRELVTRGRKGVSLTEEGRVLYRHAEAILRHIELAKQDIVSVPNAPAGRVSLGFPTAWAGLLGCELLMRVRGAYPRIVMHMTNAKGSLLREWLDAGRLDSALLFVGEPVRGLAVEPLVSEELFYVTAEPDSSPISIAEAAQRPLLLPGPDSESAHAARKLFDGQGFAVAPVAEIDQIGTLGRAIASGIGNSILPWSALCDADQQKTLSYRRFSDARPVRTVSLCFSEVVERTPALEAVAMTLKSLVRELVENGTWQGVSLIEPSPEPEHALVPQQQCG
jgi:LysR family transcriptional regulator, nitrogen assimilation regulatory protein